MCNFDPFFWAMAPKTDLSVQNLNGFFLHHDLNTSTLFWNLNPHHFMIWLNFTIWILHLSRIWIGFWSSSMRANPFLEWQPCHFLYCWVILFMTIVLPNKNMNNYICVIHLSLGYAMLTPYFKKNVIKCNLAYIGILIIKYDFTLKAEFKQYVKKFLLR